jgi:ribonuclease HII
LCVGAKPARAWGVIVPDLHYENAAGRNRGRVICGVDEVGRGPLAGPVLAAAAIIPAKGLPAALAGRINDSKKLTAKQREALFPDLITFCVYAVAEASVAEIDQLNILQASLLAMQRAVAGLTSPPDVALIDGNRCPVLPMPAQAIVRGDGQSLSIAVAAIIAKVTRDRLMQKLAATYPHYGWERNSGYGTAQHLVALRTYGATPWHRDSFAPVRAISALES